MLLWLSDFAAVQVGAVSDECWCINYFLQQR